MKKGDKIMRIKHLKAGTQMALNFSTLERAEAYVLEMRNKLPLRAEPSPEFKGTFHVVLREDYDMVTRAVANWVVENEAGITYAEHGLSAVVDITKPVWEDEENWEVEIPASPSYQSTVENMSEQQLRDSLECLRSQRKTSPRVSIEKPKAKRVKREKADPMLQALAGMDPIKKKALIEKLGLVD